MPQEFSQPQSLPDIKGMGQGTNKQSAKSRRLPCLRLLRKENVPFLPNFRWQLIKWPKPLLLPHEKWFCAHIIGTDHFLFNVAGIVLFFYIVLITIEPV